MLTSEKPIKESQCSYCFTASCTILEYSLWTEQSKWLCKARRRQSLLYYLVTHKIQHWLSPLCQDFLHYMLHGNLNTGLYENRQGKHCNCMLIHLWFPLKNYFGISKHNVSVEKLMYLQITVEVFQPCAVHLWLNSTSNLCKFELIHSSMT